jgi:cobalt/nickel transport system permease protein
MGAHLHLIDHYLSIKSPIHRIDGRIKLVFTLALILCCALLPAGSWQAYFLVFCILLALTIVANVGFGYLLKRSALALPFLLAAIPLVFRASDPPLFSFPVADFVLSISREGVIRFFSLGIKSWLSVMAAILLTSTTSFSELLLALRSLKIPPLLVAVFSLMWRYLLLMVEEVDRLTRARTSRSGKDPASHARAGGSLVWRSRVTGSMAGNMFIRSLERSERVYQAMLARGYDGEIRSVDEPPLERKVIFYLVLVIVVLFILIFSVSLLVGS